MKSFKVRADDLLDLQDEYEAADDLLDLLDLLDEYEAAAGLLSREEHRARFSALRAKVEKAVKEAESEQN